MDNNSPSWISLLLDRNILEDESVLVQYGQETETEFLTIEMKETQPSSWIYFPTEENPSLLYKFLSVEINLSPDLMLWERQTYSLLDFLGDLGGLYDALFLIVKVFVSPLSIFALNSTLLANFFRFRPSLKVEKS